MSYMNNELRVTGCGLLISTLQRDLSIKGIDRLMQANINSKLATRNSQPVTRNPQLVTHYSPTYIYPIFHQLNHTKQ